MDTYFRTMLNQNPAPKGRFWSAGQTFSGMTGNAFRRLLPTKVDAERRCTLFRVHIDPPTMGDGDLAHDEEAQTQVMDSIVSIVRTLERLK